MSAPTVAKPWRLRPGETVKWDRTADVVVGGFGGSGAACAIEAAERCSDVAAVDRLLGGGDTSICGGAIYAGGNGGTRAQRDAGFQDTVDNMYNYLLMEVAGAVDDDTLRRLCEGSLADFDWLQAHGVSFGNTFWAEKTPFPPNGYYLFYSGSEATAPFNTESLPVPRAHKVDAPGMGTGAVLYRGGGGGRASCGTHRTPDCLQRMIVDPDGDVIGVECRRLRRSIGQRLQSWIVELLRRLPPAVVWIGPHLPALFGVLGFLERRAPHDIVRLQARGGVVLATGGF